VLEVWFYLFAVIFPLDNNSMTETETISPACSSNSLTIQQWIVLVFSFLLGIAAVLTINKFSTADSSSTGSVYAAVAHP
jgi:hypothetical protein